MWKDGSQAPFTWGVLHQTQNQNTLLIPRGSYVSVPRQPQDPCVWVYVRVTGDSKPALRKWLSVSMCWLIHMLYPYDSQRTGSSNPLTDGSITICQWVAGIIWCWAVVSWFRPSFPSKCLYSSIIWATLYYSPYWQYLGHVTHQTSPLHLVLSRNYHEYLWYFVFSAPN